MPRPMSGSMVPEEPSSEARLVAVEPSAGSRSWSSAGSGSGVRPREWSSFELPAGLAWWAAGDGVGRTKRRTAAAAARARSGRLTQARRLAITIRPATAGRAAFRSGDPDPPLVGGCGHVDGAADRDARGGAAADRPADRRAGPAGPVPRLGGRWWVGRDGRESDVPGPRRAPCQSPGAEASSAGGRVSAITASGPTGRTPTHCIRSPRRSSFGTRGSTSICREVP